MYIPMHVFVCIYYIFNSMASSQELRGHFEPNFVSSFSNWGNITIVNPIVPTQEDPGVGPKPWKTCYLKKPSLLLKDHCEVYVLYGCNMTQYALPKL